MKWRSSWRPTARRATVTVRRPDARSVPYTRTKACAKVGWGPYKQGQRPRVVVQWRTRASAWRLLHVDGVITSQCRSLSLLPHHRPTLLCKVPKSSPYALCALDKARPLGIDLVSAGTILVQRLVDGSGYWSCSTPQGDRTPTRRVPGNTFSAMYELFRFNQLEIGRPGSPVS